MTKNHDIAAPTNRGTRRGNNTPTPQTAARTPIPTPRSVKRVAALGIPVSLAAAAAVSFAGLAELGTFAGIDHPWLMPVAIDVYATTATLIAMLLPEGHRARRTAVWNARLGLAMSMSGNALARALHLGTRGYTVSDALLTFIGAWPSLIVERLLHLQGHLTVGDDAADGHAPAATTDAAAATTTGQRRPPSTPSRGDGGGTASATTAAPASDAETATTTTERDGGASVTHLAERRRPNGGDDTGGGHGDDTWARIAAPHYRTFVRTSGGTRPNAPQLAALLRAAGHPELSKTRAREIRRATERHIAEHPHDEPEREEQAAS